MSYLLVIQFAAHGNQDFERFIKFEKLLISGLPDNATVDGHDFGCGEFNLFIITSDPDATFLKAKSVLVESSPELEFKAGYRSLDEDEYKVLWPVDLKSFVIA